MSSGAVVSGVPLPGQSRSVRHRRSLWSHVKQSVRILIRIVRWMGTRERTFGLMVLVVMFGGVSFNRKWKEALETFHPEYVIALETWQFRLSSAWADLNRYPTKQLAKEFLFVPGSLRALAIEIARRILDLSMLVWLSFVNSLKLGYLVARLIITACLKTFPHLQPIAVAVADEYSALSSRSKTIIWTAATLNLLLLTGWRSGFFAKLVTAVGRAHRRVAQFFTYVGPYLLLYAFLYLPLKLVLDFSAFRTLFQASVYIVAFGASSVACWLAIRGEDYSVEQQISLMSTVWSAVVTPRTTRSVRRTRGGRQGIELMVHHTLTFWIALSSWHAMLWLPTALMGKLVATPVPTFNIWNFAGSVLPPAKRIVLSKQVLQNIPAVPNLVKGLVLIDELVTFCLVLSLLRQDAFIGAKVKQACIGLFEKSVTTVTGFRIAFLPDGGSGSPSSQSVISVWVNSFTRVPAWLEVKAISIHLLPIVTVLMPSVVVWLTLATLALAVPQLYGLRALASHKMAESVYWLAYYTLLEAFILSSETTVLGSLVGLRLKLIVVSVIQLFANNPVRWGSWMLKVVRSARRSLPASGPSKQVWVAPQPPDTPSEDKPTTSSSGGRRINTITRATRFS